MYKFKERGYSFVHLPLLTTAGRGAASAGGRVRLVGGSGAGPVRLAGRVGDVVSGVASRAGTRLASLGARLAGLVDGGAGEGGGLVVAVVKDGDVGGDGGSRRADIATALMALGGGRGGVESRDIGAGRDGGVRDEGGGQPGGVPGVGSLMANRGRAGDERGDCVDDGGGVDGGGDHRSSARSVVGVRGLVGRRSRGLLSRFVRGLSWLVRWLVSRLVGGQGGRLVGRLSAGLVGRRDVSAVGCSGRLVGGHMSRVGGTSRVVASSLARSNNDSRGGQGGGDVGSTMLRGGLGDGAGGDSSESGHGLGLGSILATGDARLVSRVGDSGNTSTAWLMSRV